MSDADLPTAFCWRLSGPSGPSLSQALRVGEAVRAVVVRSGNRLGLGQLPEELNARQCLAARAPLLAVGGP